MVGNEGKRQFIFQKNVTHFPTKKKQKKLVGKKIKKIGGKNKKNRSKKCLKKNIGSKN